MNNGDVSIPLESEILRTKEDAMIKNAEILGYKMVLKIAEKIDAKNAIDTLKKNLQEGHASNLKQSREREKKESAAG